jgi:hypothetical protein
MGGDLVRRCLGKRRSPRPTTSCIFMKIKLDENIPVTAKGTLVNVSSDIHAVYEEGLSAADDGTPFVFICAICG